MQNVLLNDGTLHTVSGMAEILELIRENFSRDLADNMKEWISGNIAALKWENENAKEELASYKDDLEILKNILEDIYSDTEEILSYINENDRTEKEKLYDMMESIKYRAWNAL